jgi:predicted nuclease with TOPRIM domain
MLVNNPRFQQEYREFTEKISRVSDENVKSQLNQLLIKLLGEVRSIDRQHEELNRGAKMSTEMLTDHRSSLMSIRQQLVKKLEECERAGYLLS